jgi:hypothetical protein
VRVKGVSELKRGCAWNEDTRPSFGSRKLLGVLAILGMAVDFTVRNISGSLNELLRERQRKTLIP